MPVYEMRAALYSYRPVFRADHNFTKHILILGDSLSAGGSISKCRNDARSMRWIVQSIVALSLVTGSCLQYRWLSSELNSADGPSRGLWHLAVPDFAALAQRVDDGSTSRPRLGQGCSGVCCPLGPQCSLQHRDHLPPGGLIHRSQVVVQVKRPAATMVGCSSVAAKRRRQSVCSRLVVERRSKARQFLGLTFLLTGS